MNNLKNIRVPDGKIIVPLDYDQLQELMCNCAMLAIDYYRKEAMKVTEQKWLSSTEAAKVFGRSMSTINRWKKSGYLTARTLGGKDYFSTEEVNQLAIKMAS